MAVTGGRCLFCVAVITLRTFLDLLQTIIALNKLLLFPLHKVKLFHHPFYVLHTLLICQTAIICVLILGCLFVAGYTRIFLRCNVTCFAFVSFS